VKKSSLDDDFWYDLVMILDSGLLFWATLYIWYDWHLCFLGV